MRSAIESAVEESAQNGAPLYICPPEPSPGQCVVIGNEQSQTVAEPGEQGPTQVLPGKATHLPFIDVAPPPQTPQTGVSAPQTGQSTEVPVEKRIKSDWKVRLAVIRVASNFAITATILTLVKGADLATGLEIAGGVATWSGMHQLITPSYVQWLYYKKWIPNFRVRQPKTQEEIDALARAGKLRRAWYAATHIHVPPPTDSQKGGFWTPIKKNFAVAVVFNSLLMTAIYNLGVNPHLFDTPENALWTLGKLAFVAGSAVWMEYFPQRINQQMGARLLARPDGDILLRRRSNLIGLGQSGAVVSANLFDNIGTLFGITAKATVGAIGAAVYKRDKVKKACRWVLDRLGFGGGQ